MTEIEKDINVLAYQKMAENSKWLEKYQGQWVVFILGSFVGAWPTLKVAVEVLRSEHPNQAAFFKEVGDDSELDIGGADMVPEE